MRLAIVLGALCALTQAAAAETGDCNAMSDPAAKLACYNNEPPPRAPRAATVRPPRVSPPSPVASNGPARIDQPGEDDAAVKAKLRSLCRGC